MDASWLWNDQAVVHQQGVCVLIVACSVCTAVNAIVGAPSCCLVASSCRQYYRQIGACSIQVQASRIGSRHEQAVLIQHYAAGIVLVCKSTMFISQQTPHLLHRQAASVAVMLLCLEDWVPQLHAVVPSCQAAHHGLCCVLLGTPTAPAKSWRGIAGVCCC